MLPGCGSPVCGGGQLLNCHQMGYPNTRIPDHAKISQAINLVLIISYS